MTEFSLNLMRQRETTKVYRDRGKMLGMLAIGVVFFGACFLGFWHEAGAGRIPPLKEDLLWFAFAVIAILILALVVKMLDGRPALEFSDAGLLATDIAADAIPWSAIRGAAIRTYKRNKFVELQIDPAIARGLRLTWRHSKFGLVSKLMGFHHYYISVIALDHDADYLAELIDFYRKKNETVK